MAAVRDAVVAAMTGKMTAEAIVDATGLTIKQVGPVLAAMTKSHAALRTGERGAYEYELTSATSPPKGAGPRKKKAARKAKRKAERAPATRLNGHRRTPAAPSAPNGHDNTDFAITAGAALSIKQGEQAMILEPSTFARLRLFINQSCPIWDPDGNA